MQLKDILQNIVNEPYENLVNIAKTAIEDIAPFFNEQSNDGRGIKILLEILCTCMAVDGKLTSLEHRFFCDVFVDIDSDELVKILTDFNADEVIDNTNAFVDSLPSNIKSKIMTFCACIMAVDETITEREVAVIDFLCR